MALELIVPLALLGAFFSSSGVTWMRRQRRLDEARTRGTARGWIVPVRVRSAFPMDIRGEVLVDTALPEAAIVTAVAARALEAGYERAAGMNCTAAFHRGSEWRALSSFDLCDVPSEVVLWLEPRNAAGVTTVRCVMTYRTTAHYVSDEDVEQATAEFSAIIESLEPLRAVQPPAQ
jgi:hypothetical protein